jgi:hypothetical protein
VTAGTLANVAGNWFGNPGNTSNGYEAYGRAMGLPTATVQDQLVNSSTPVLQSALIGYSIFGAGVLGANYLSKGTAINTYTATNTHLYNLTGTNAFELGLLTMGAYNGGFSSLTFTVKEGAATLLAEAFTTLSAAQTYFTDDAISLGKITGAVDLTFSYSLTASLAMGAGISYVVADEPSSAGAAKSVVAGAARFAHSGELDRFGTVPGERLFLTSRHAADLRAILTDFNAGYQRAAIASNRTLTSLAAQARPEERLGELVRRQRR